MILLIAIAVGTIALFVVRSTRPFAVAGLAALIIVWMYDNTTEEQLGTSAVEVKSTKLTPIGPNYVLRMKVKNKSNTYLQDMDVEVKVEDCASTCAVIGRQVQEIQVLAKPGQVKEFVVTYPFNDMIDPKGTVKASASVVSALGDNS